MNTLLKGSLAALGILALAVPAAAQFGGPPPPPNTGIPVFTHMMGGAGDGHFTGIVDGPKGTFCYLMNVNRLENVTAAHVHLGGPGETGRPVITLETPDEGTGSGCTEIAPTLSEAILANPQGYYVNVHTRVQPDGAIRGQLMR